jgi:hypothetical protein
MDDLNPMMFEYLDGTPMWDGIERVMHYWSCRVSEVNFVDLDSPSEEIVLLSSSDGDRSGDPLSFRCLFPDQLS